MTAQVSVALINRKLAYEGKVLTKKPKDNGVYVLLDTKAGNRTLLMDRELLKLAREIGAIE